MDILHKIKQLNLTPLRDNKNELTGKCKADFVVEVLALVEADETADFANRKRELESSIDDYSKVVVSRNIFGPANNAPTMRLSKKTYYNNEEISYRISARDSDKDELTYELVDAGGIEGAELVQKSSSATFTTPALKNGDYVVKFRATDDGLPAKSVETEWRFTVKDPKPVKKDDPPPPPPKVIQAEETKIAFITARDGVFETRIKVLLTGEVFVLKVGDSFDLDDAKWTVRDIRRGKVSIETDGKLREYRGGSVLSSPLKETEVASTEPVESSDEAEIGKVSS